MTIYKYSFPVLDEVCITMPSGAILLDVQVQAGYPCLRALVNPDNPLENRDFWIRGTGHSCDGINAKDYVGTFQLNGGSLVFHMFEGTAA